MDASVNQLTPNVSITFTSPLLRPVCPGANSVTLHIWTPNVPITLTVSDNVLERVSMWKSPSCTDGERGRFQTARIMATANFSSGTNNQFTANVLPFIADRVSPIIVVFIIICGK